MGEATIVVGIKGRAYIIKDGHHNSALKAVEIALKRHEDYLNREDEYFRKNDIRDENNRPIYADRNLENIYVYYAAEEE